MGYDRNYGEFCYQITANTTVKRDKSSVTFTDCEEGVLTVYVGTETLKDLKARYDRLFIVASRPGSKKSRPFGPKNGFTLTNSFRVRAYDPAGKKDKFKPARIMVEKDTSSPQGLWSLWLRIDHEGETHVGTAGVHCGVAI